jgi:prepilin peptidase CpaA
MRAAPFLTAVLVLLFRPWSELGPQSPPWIAAVILALVAGVWDARWRRIPNWLNVPGALVGIVANTILFHWPGLEAALMGMLLGLALLLPFVLVRSLGAGDWKFAGALGAYLGPRQLLSVLVVAIFVEGAIAFALVIYKRRVAQTFRNIVLLLAGLYSLRMPAFEVSLDNPESTKIPRGIAMSIAVLLCAILESLGRFRPL